MPLYYQSIGVFNGFLALIEVKIGFLERNSKKPYSDNQQVVIG
jgi:hypothetical protein